MLKGTEVVLTKEQSASINWIEFKDEDFPFIRGDDKSIAIRYEKKDEDEIRVENAFARVFGLNEVTVDDTDFAYTGASYSYPVKGPLVAYAFLNDEQVKEIFK